MPRDKDGISFINNGILCIMRDLLCQTESIIFQSYCSLMYIYIYIVRELYVFYFLFRKLFHAPSACGIVFIRRIQRLWVSYPFSLEKTACGKKRSGRKGRRKKKYHWDPYIKTSRAITGMSSGLNRRRKYNGRYNKR